jgi:hypothetical protein
MHADLVPTLLGSAAIRYVDERQVAIDLGVMSPAANRTRWVMRRLGEKVDAFQLRQVHTRVAAGAGAGEHGKQAIEALHFVHAIEPSKGHRESHPRGRRSDTEDLDGDLSEHVPGH